MSSVIERIHGEAKTTKLQSEEDEDKINSMISNEATETISRDENLLYKTNNKESQADSQAEKFTYMNMKNVDERNCRF